MTKNIYSIKFNLACEMVLEHDDEVNYPLTQQQLANALFELPREVRMLINQDFIGGNKNLLGSWRKYHNSVGLQEKSIKIKELK